MRSLRSLESRLARAERLSRRPARVGSAEGKTTAELRDFICSTLGISETQLVQSIMPVPQLRLDVAAALAARKGARS